MTKTCPECHDSERLSLVVERFIQRDVDEIWITDGSVAEWEESEDNPDVILEQKIVGVMCRGCGWRNERYDDKPWWTRLIDFDAALEDPEESHA